MRFVEQRRRLAACVGLAAVLGLSLVPNWRAASDVTPRSTEQARAETKVSPDKIVSLMTDGSFRAVVLAVDGRPVPQARLTLTRSKDGRVTPVNVQTGSRGQARVEGMKPGLYPVRVEAERNTYQGMLQVNPTNEPQGTIQQVVVFMVLPQIAETAPGQIPDPESDPANQQGSPLADPGGFGGLGGGGRALLYGLGGGAVATAIALPLTLGSGRNKNTPPAPVASP
jgi:hypothetical protein